MLILGYKYGTKNDLMYQLILKEEKMNKKKDKVIGWVWYYYVNRYTEESDYNRQRKKVWEEQKILELLKIL